VIKFTYSRSRIKQQHKKKIKLRRPDHESIDRRSILDISQILSGHSRTKMRDTLFTVVANRSIKPYSNRSPNLTALHTCSAFCYQSPLYPCTFLPLDTPQPILLDLFGRLTQCVHQNSPVCMNFIVRFRSRLLSHDKTPHRTYPRWVFSAWLNPPGADCRSG